MSKEERETAIASGWAKFQAEVEKQGHAFVRGQGEDYDLFNGVQVDVHISTVPRTAHSTRQEEVLRAVVAPACASGGLRRRGLTFNVLAKRGDLNWTRVVKQAHACAVAVVDEQRRQDEAAKAREVTRRLKAGHVADLQCVLENMKLPPLNERGQLRLSSARGLTLSLSVSDEGVSVNIDPTPDLPTIDALLTFLQVCQGSLS